jgi:predicted PurR-regulated permease PerM
MNDLERLSRMGVVVVATVAGVAALKLAEEILGPMALALVVGVVVSPLGTAWERTGLPAALGALLTLGLTLTVLGLLGLVLQPQVSELAAQAPKVWADLQDSLDTLRSILRNLTKLSQDVSAAMAPEQAAAPAVDPAAALPSVTDALLLAPAFLGQFAVFAGTLFFFVLTRSEIYAWTALRLSGPTERAGTTRRLLAAERKVSRYFLAVALVNAGLGTALALVLAVLGVPGAALWGLMAFLLNFVVYLGAAAVSVGLLFAGIAQFDGVLALLPVLSFVALNGIEGQFVTPSVVGRQLALNPLVVFVALIFGIWLWGPLGGVVAIPLLVWVLVLNDALSEPGEG